MPPLPDYFSPESEPGVAGARRVLGCYAGKIGVHQQPGRRLDMAVCPGCKRRMSLLPAPDRLALVEALAPAFAKFRTFLGWLRLARRDLAGPIAVTGQDRLPCVEAVDLVRRSGGVAEFPGDLGGRLRGPSTPAVQLPTGRHRQVAGM